MCQSAHVVWSRIFVPTPTCPTLKPGGAGCVTWAGMVRLPQHMSDIPAAQYATKPIERVLESRMI
jgi:hypothetical protein